MLEIGDCLFLRFFNARKYTPTFDKPIITCGNRSYKRLTNFPLLPSGNTVTFDGFGGWINNIDTRTLRCVYPDI